MPECLSKSKLNKDSIMQIFITRWHVMCVCVGGGAKSNFMSTM